MGQPQAAPGSSACGDGLLVPRPKWPVRIACAASCRTSCWWQRLCEFESRILRRCDPAERRRRLTVGAVGATCQSQFQAMFQPGHRR